MNSLNQKPLNILILSLVFFLTFLSGCATPPEKIQTSYVSPVQYDHYDCDQIAMEMRHVGQRANDLYYDLKDEADTDSAQTAVGLILFWPALFFLEGGDDERAAEYARLKGERQALEDAAVIRKCDIAMMPKFEDPEAVAKQRLEQKQAEEANRPTL